MNLTLGSVSGFLPTIVAGFGYTTARAQLMTVPPYAVALVFMLLLTTYSDRVQSRGIPVMVPFMLGIVGWAILMTVPAAHATQAQFSGRYFACCCIVTAGYTNIPLIIGKLFAPFQLIDSMAIGQHRKPKPACHLARHAQHHRSMPIRRCFFPLPVTRKAWLSQGLYREHRVPSSGPGTRYGHDCILQDRKPPS